MPSLVVTLSILIPIVAIALHLYLFTGVAPPPSDFGSGQMFDLIAPRYDLVNRVLAVRMDLGWRQIMVEKIKASTANVAQPQLLDIATGTADVALLLSKSIPNAQILGMDPSNNMLSIGRTKVTDAGKDDSIRLDYGAVSHFPGMLEVQKYDAATMSFGIRNVPDREKALCDIHRVLKSNDSMFCILEFSEPDESTGVMGYFAKLFIRYVVPIVGGILSGKPREYLHLQNSIKDFPSPKNFVKMMEGLSCGENGTGRFIVDELKQMNFGSVQLYVTRPVADLVVAEPVVETEN
jgi:demethylmenaquinone methyltransferase/2-methoxy-6-polyprenyl-1,4-benzoquinol methylase